jgi:hypothetical protein
MGEFQEAKEELGRTGIMLSLCTVFWAFALIVRLFPIISALKISFSSILHPFLTRALIFLDPS